jgi:hypothetical protein
MTKHSQKSTSLFFLVFLDNVAHRDPREIRETQVHP